MQHLHRYIRMVVALAVAAGALFSALADGGTRWAFPTVPAVRHVDSESSVCVPITNSVPSQTEFSFDMSFDATASNNAAVAIGEDMDGDGNLSFSETDVVVGWDCGRYFLDRPKAGRRYESAVYAEPKARQMSYLFRMDGLGGSIVAFNIDVDEGAFGPGGVVGAGAVGLWSDELADGGDRHRVRWESLCNNKYNQYSSSVTISSVRLSGDLTPVSPSSVVSGGRVAASIFGVYAKYVLYSSGAASVSADWNKMTVHWGSESDASAGSAGMYIDLVGAGDVHFSYTFKNYWDTRVYVDDKLVWYSRGAGNVPPTVHVGSGAGTGTWCWKPGWNMLRVTRRGLFRDSGPSGGFTLRQRGGIIQFH